MDQQQAALRHVFENNGITYLYDYDLVTFEQAQLATEVMYFKQQTLEKAPKSINDLVLSGSAEYMARAFAFLIVKTEAGVTTEKFRRTTTYDKALAFTQALPAAEWNRVEDCLRDFFGRTGRGELVSNVLSHASQLGVNEIVSMLLQPDVMNAMRNAAESSSSASASSASTSPENSTDDSAK